jgi:PAS domain S-box-containing protein
MSGPDVPAARPGVSALRIAIAYAIVAGLYIFFSDYLLALVGLSHQKQQSIQTLKGMLFVVITASLLWFAMRRSMQRLVAARRDAEASEQRYRQLIDTSNEGVWVIDVECRTRMANRRMASMLGVTLEQMAGSSVEDFLFPEDRAMLEHLKSCRESGKSMSFDLRLRRSDGAELWALVVSTPIVESDGKVLQIINMLSDITERRIAEQRLRVSEELYRGLFQSNPVPMYIIDESNLKFLEVNDAAIERYGYSREEMRNLTLKDIRPPEYVPALLENLRQMPRAIAYAGEWVHQRRNGQLIDVEVNTFALDYHGRPARLVMAADITQRKRAEEAIKQMNVTLERRVRERTIELQAANEALEAFSYSVSHDLRRPLASAQTIIRELAEKHGEMLGPDGASLLMRVAGLSGRLEAMIKDLLEFSRQSPASIELERLSLVLLATEVVGQVEREIGEGAADFIIKEPLHWVLGRRSILFRVLVNLVRNAVTYVAPGVHPIVHIWDEDRGDRIRLYVEDNGIGIDPSQRRHVFELKSDADQPDAPRMGLAIVKMGIERLGGRVGVEPAPNRGSRFWIELRAAAPL